MIIATKSRSSLRVHVHTYVTMKTAIYRNEDTPDFACLFVAQTPNDACYSAFSSPNDQPGYATFPAKKPEINHLI